MADHIAIDGSDASDASDTNWRQMLHALHTELTSNGGSHDLVNGIRARFEWSEAERKQLKDDYHENINKLREINKKMTELKACMEEALAARDVEVEKLTKELDERDEVIGKSLGALKSLEARFHQKAMELEICQGELAGYKGGKPQ